MTNQELKEIIKETITECWKGYKQVGMKEKGGKNVPNCVPVKEEKIEEGSSPCTRVTQKASSSRKDKKWMKCAKQTDGSIKRVHWGDPNAKVTGDSGNTSRKKAFRARHDCKNAKKGTANDLACKDW